MRFTPTGLVLFGLSIHWYGLLIAAGMALGVALAARREGRLGLPKDTALDVALAGIPAAIVCARLYYVAFSWDSYADRPIRALFVWEGGLAIYGGLLGALLAGFIYARKRRVSMWKLTDLAAPSIALGQAIGRWGNFINQEAYGGAVARAWQRRFPIAVYIRADGLWHYATFFYESAWCLLVAAALLAAERRGRFRRDGDVFRSYAFLYALERALVEGLRADSLYLGPLRVSQLLSIVALLGLTAAQLWRGRRRGWSAAALGCCAALAVALAGGTGAAALVFAAGALACWWMGVY